MRGRRICEGIEDGRLAYRWQSIEIVKGYGYASVMRRGKGGEERRERGEGRVESGRIGREAHLV